MGPNGPNLRILCTISAVKGILKMPLLIGADWNMAPEEIPEHWLVDDGRLGDLCANPLRC